MCAEWVLPDSDATADAMHRSVPSRVVPVSPVALEREGMTLALQRDGFRVPAAFATLREAEIGLSGPDGAELVMVDAASDEAADVWLDGLVAFRRRFDAIRIVALVSRSCVKWAAACWRAGLDGCLSKDRRADILTRQLKLVLLGQRVFIFDPARKLDLAHELFGGGSPPAPSLPASISQSDVELLRCMREGVCNRAIASKLYVNESTIKVRVKSVMHKINATNRTQAAVWALNHGL